MPYDDHERYGQEYAHRRAVYHRRDEYYTSPRGTEPSVRSVINHATMITVEQRREPYANDYRDRMHSALKMLVASRRNVELQRRRSRTRRMACQLLQKNSCADIISRRIRLERQNVDIMISSHISLTIHQSSCNIFAFLTLAH